jgi:drug/metabolite transporter (DMT)-like permease
VSFSNHELPPLFGASLRFALASLLFLLIRGIQRVPLPDRRASAGAALYGLLGFGASYALLYYALVGLEAGTISVIMAAVPLFTLVFAVLLGQERFTFRGVAGGLLAIAGIFVISLGTVAVGHNTSYLIAAILGAIATAGSSVVVKALPEARPVNMNTIGMGSGAIVLAMGSLVVGEPWHLPQNPQTWVAVGWLVIFGSVGLFQLLLFVIQRLTASAAVYAITGMPVVAIGFGALLLDQPITVEVLAGAALVLIAVYVGAASGAPGMQGDKPSAETRKRYPIQSDPVP